MRSPSKWTWTLELLKNLRRGLWVSVAALRQYTLEASGYLSRLWEIVYLFLQNPWGGQQNERGEELTDMCTDYPLLMAASAWLPRLASRTERPRHHMLEGHGMGNPWLVRYE